MIQRSPGEVVQPGAVIEQQHKRDGLVPLLACEWPAFEVDYLREYLRWGLDSFRARTYAAE